jgi:hypothetical protein
MDDRNSVFIGYSIKYRAMKSFLMFFQTSQSLLLVLDALVGGFAGPHCLLIMPTTHRESDSEIRAPESHRSCWAQGHIP